MKLRILIMTMLFALLMSFTAFARTYYVPYGGSCEVTGDVDSCCSTKPTCKMYYDNTSGRTTSRSFSWSASQDDYSHDSWSKYWSYYSAKSYMTNISMYHCSCNVYRECGGDKSWYKGEGYDYWYWNTIYAACYGINGSVYLEFEPTSSKCDGYDYYSIYTCSHPANKISGWQISGSTHYRYCTQCGTWTTSHTCTNSYTSVSNTAHKITCSTCGITTNSSEAHSFGSNYDGGDGYTYKKCSRCNKVNCVGGNTYYIAFNANGGSGSMGNQTMTYGTSANLSNVTYTRNGYLFNGWNTAANGSGTNYTNQQSVSNLAKSGTVTLYAQWRANTYTVSYNANGGSGLVENQLMYCDQTANLRECTLSRTGYTFTGWNTLANGEGDSYSDQQSVMNLTTVGGVTITLYAQWSENSYAISYELNGGEWEFAAGAVTSRNYNQTVTLPTAGDVYRDGYFFTGWYTTSECTGVPVTLSSAGVADDYTYYAGWEALEGRDSGTSPKVNEEISVN